MPLPAPLATKGALLGLLHHRLALGLAVFLATAGGGAVAVVATNSSAVAPKAAPSVAASTAAAPASGAIVAAAAAAPAAPAAAPAAPVAASPAAKATTKAPVMTRATAPAVKAAVNGTVAAPVVPVAVAPAPVPSQVVTCPSAQRLTDAEINWILKEVAQTATKTPSVAPGAVTIKSSLSPMLGQNLCASQAQPTVTALCANTDSHATMQAMFSQLPSYEQSMIGNPCGQPLATTLTRIAPYVSMLG